MSEDGNLTEPVSVGVPIPSRARIRQLLQQVLLTDADLDAFCLDSFEAVFRRFSGGMDRVAKVNLLLALVEPTEVMTCLRHYFRNNSGVLVEIDQSVPPGPACALGGKDNDHSNMLPETNQHVPDAPDVPARPSGQVRKDNEFVVAVRPRMLLLWICLIVGVTSTSIWTILSCFNSVMKAQQGDLAKPFPERMTDSAKIDMVLHGVNSNQLKDGSDINLNRRDLSDYHIEPKRTRRHKFDNPPPTRVPDSNAEPALVEKQNITIHVDAKLGETVTLTSSNGQTEASRIAKIRLQRQPDGRSIPDGAEVIFELTLPPGLLSLHCSRQPKSIDQIVNVQKGKKSYVASCFTD